MMNMLNFFLNRIGPAALVSILVIVVLGLLAVWLFRKQTRLFLTIMIPLGLIGLLILLFSFKQISTKPLQPMSSTAMFKKMEYIEHLKLVSFYSEEVIVLGTKEKVQRVVDKMRKELGDMDQQIAINDSIQQLWQKRLDSVITASVDDKNAFEAEKQQLKDLESNYKDFKRCKNENLCACPPQLADSLSLSLYENYKGSFQALSNFQKEFDKKGWRSLGQGLKVLLKARKVMKDSLQALTSRHEQNRDAVAGRLLRLVNIENQKILDQKNFSKANKKRLNEARRSISDKRDQSRRKWEKSVNKRQKLETRLKEAEQELAFAREQGAEINPEVLIIVPAEVSVYINMKEVSMNVENLEDSVLKVQIPPLAFDPVQIELPEDSAVYKLDRHDNELVFSQQGAYYDLFGQLKEAILDKEKDVKDKAIENGIIEVGEELAESYLVNFISPLGLEIQIVDSNLNVLKVANPVVDPSALP